MSSILEVMRDLVKSNREEANAIVTEVQSKRTKVGKVVHELRKDEKTEDVNIKKFQSWLEKVSTQINEKTAEIDNYIKANLIAESSMSDEEFNAKKEQYKLLKSNITGAESLAAGQPGFTAELFAELPALLSLSTGKEVGSSTGATGKRPSLASCTVNGTEVYTEKDGKDGGKVRSANFTAAALFITKDSKVKTTAGELSAAAFETAKTEDLTQVTSVEFIHTVTDKANVTHSYTVVAVPTDKGTESTEE